jgi:hypothetical protein
MAFKLSFTGKVSSRRDARRAPRRKVHALAWIKLGGIAARECTIVNISRSGVQLRLDPSINVAGEFVLLQSRGEYPGRRCRVKWRRGSIIGAEFI